jgi:hypothetical protein
VKPKRQTTKVVKKAETKQKHAKRLKLKSQVAKTEQASCVKKEIAETSLRPRALTSTKLI